MQAVALQPEVAQHAAERALEVALRERRRGRPGGQNGTIEQDHLVAEVGHAAEVVRGDEHQMPGRLQFAHQLDDGRLGLDVDAGERLIEQDDATFLGKRACEKHALLLPAGQLADLAGAEGRHADTGERLVDLGAIACRGYAQESHVAVAAHHHHVLDEHGEVPVDLLGLRHVGDEIASHRLGGRQPRDPHLAARRAHEAHDRLEQRRLARAVDADEAANGTGPQLEARARQRGVAVGIGDSNATNRQCSDGGRRRHDRRM